MPGAFVPPPRRPADACLPDTMDMPFGIFTVRMDENFTVLAGNGRYYERIGYTPEQLRDELNNQAARYMHPDSLEAVRSAVQEAIRQGKATLSFENKIIRRDGKTVWMTVEGAFVDSSDGRIMRGYILDGTSRKEAEERSRLNEERYRIAIALTGSCIWEYDFASHSIFQMDGSLSKYTLHDAIIPDVPASIIQSGVVHADFAEDLRAMYRRLEEGAQFGEWIGKTRRAAGGYSWTKITYASIFDDSGRPVRAVGVSEDIYQKMREDREIRRKIAAATSFDLEASAELSPDTAWLLDQAPEIVYVSDPVTYDMLYMNAAGLAAIGLPAKDIGGQKCYKALYGLEAPCPFCVNSLLREDRWYSWEHDNRLLGRRYHLRGKRISWAGKPAHIELAVDISDGRYLNQRLADKTDTVNILLQCIDSLIHTGELDSAIQSMLGHIGEFYGAERAYILGLAETDAAIRAFNKWSRADGDAGLLPLLPPSIISRWAQAFQKRETIFLNNPETLRATHPDEYAFWREHGIRSYFLIPFDGETDGVRYFGIVNPTQHTDEAPLLRSLSFFVSNEMAKRQMRQQQEFAIFHDLLTGLLNRNSYLRYLRDLSRAPLSSLGVAAANLNGLKAINQDYGHIQGNQTVIRTADILRKCFPQGQVYRFSGDEFIVLCENVPYQKFLEQVQASRLEAEEMLNGGFSLGFAWTDVDIDPEELIDHANERMLLGKRRYYEQTVSSSHNRSAMLRGLLQALKAGHFHMVLQPKVDVRTQKILGAEALVRLRDPQYGDIPPNRFIPLLEKERLIRYVDLFIFEEVCKTLRRWKASGWPLLPVSLNFSRATLLEGDLLNTLVDITSRYGVDRRLMEIEITERVGDIERETLSTIGLQIAELGFPLSLDDFGSKYSSMSMLSVLKFQVVKLDRSLVYDLVSHTESRIVARHMLDMCRDLGIACVAEGVETREQLHILQEMGCTAIQGYLFSRPLPPDAFEKFAGDFFGE